MTSIPIRSRNRSRRLYPKSVWDKKELEESFQEAKISTIHIKPLWRLLATQQPPPLSLFDAKRGTEMVREGGERKEIEKERGKERERGRKKERNRNGCKCFTEWEEVEEWIERYQGTRLFHNYLGNWPAARILEVLKKDFLICTTKVLVDKQLSGTAAVAEEKESLKESLKEEENEGKEMKSNPSIVHEDKNQKNEKISDSNENSISNSKRYF